MFYRLKYLYHFVLKIESRFSRGNALANRVMCSLFTFHVTIAGEYFASYCVANGLLIYCNRDTIFTMLSKIFGFGQKKREKKAHPSERYEIDFTILRFDVASSSCTKRV